MAVGLALAEDVYFCVTQAHGVFLDLKKDAYSAIPPRPAEEGGGVGAGQATALIAGHEDELVSAGLLVTSPPPAPASSLEAYRAIRRPAENIFGFDDQRAFGMARALYPDLRVTMRDCLEFVRACRRASVMLRSRHIHAIVQRIRNRKLRANRGAADIDVLRPRVAAFRRLRPWYPRDYVCLYDAIALIEFLAMRGIYPDWVFGVQAQPFGAHCWVQSEGVALNDGVEYVDQFTPIMVV